MSILVKALLRCKSFACRSTARKQYQFLFRDAKPRRAAFQADRKVRELWIPQIPSVTNAIEISDMRKGTGGWVKKATGK